MVPDMTAQISQNRKHREDPDGLWLSKSGMVPRTARFHDRLSTSSLTGAEAAQADLLTTLPSAFVASHTHQEVIKGFHKDGFSFLKWLLNGSLYLRCEILVMSKYTSISVNLFTSIIYVVPVMSKYRYRRDLPDMYIYFHVHGVEWAYPSLRTVQTGFNHLPILLFMIDFNPKRNASSSIVGLHVYSKSCCICSI